MSDNTDNTKSSSTSGIGGGAPGSASSSGDAWSSARAEALRRNTAVDDRPRRGSSGWPWAVTGIALAFAAGLLANPWFEAKVRSHLPEPLRSVGAADTATTGASGEQIAQLEARLSALESRPGGTNADLQPLYERIARLEAGQSAAPAPEMAGEQVPVVDTGSAQRLAALEARLNTLDQSVVNAAAQAQTLQNAHAQLDSRLTQFATETNAQLQALQAQGTQSRTLLLVSAVRRALENGQPMTGAVDMLSQSLGRDNADVAALQAVADGAPTVQQMRQRLARHKQVLLAKAPATAQGPWYERVGESLRSLVQVRRADEPAAAVSGDVAGQLATMDQRLARGDVQGALAASQSLPQNVQTRLQPLLNDMRAVVDARAALSRLETAALAG